MRVKNEYVQIKVGNRTYIKQNMILDIYLKRLFDMQYATNHNYTVINLLISLKLEIFSK